jgi:nucleotide-binding universal stress UspA family protein
MPPRNILVPVDGSICAINAVSYADDLADKCGANLNLLYVLQPEGSYILPEHLEKLAEAMGDGDTDDSIAKSETDRIWVRRDGWRAMCWRWRKKTPRAKDFSSRSCKAARW